jgi:4-hydroxythreonine-4-phosphate dehydrogenase
LSDYLIKFVPSKLQTKVVILMKKSENIVVGISIGDLNGIGSEIILKTFEDSRMLEFCTPIIFASAKTMSFFKTHFNSEINFNNINNLNQLASGKFNVLNCWNEQVNIEFGKEDLKIGAYAIKSLQTATKALKDGDIDVLVTAPINKHNIQSNDFKFPGHTDYLAQELEGESLMFMVTDSLRVGLLTDHVPVKDIVEHVTEALIVKKINTVYNSLLNDFGIVRPKIAVLGINPHTGDNGVIGNEDDTILRPTLEKIKEEGKLVYGPYAADSFFGSSNYKNFDAIIATYHDQGLIPFKTLSFGQGVNFTAGLNKVRTSPDHGTAYEIAGKGVADANSFKEAVFTAIQIFKNRLEYSELTSNPLKKA